MESNHLLSKAEYNYLETIKTLNSALDLQNERNLELQNSLDAAQKKESLTASMYQELAINTDKLKIELDSYKGEAIFLKSIIDVKEAEASERDAEIRELRTLNENMKININKLSSKNSVLDNENSSLRQEIEDLNSELSQLEDELAEKSDNCEKLLISLDNEEQKQIDLRKQIENLKKMNFAKPIPLPKTKLTPPPPPSPKKEVLIETGEELVRQYLKNNNNNIVEAELLKFDGVQFDKSGITKLAIIGTLILKKNYMNDSYSLKN